MKKILSLILILALSLAALSSCAGKPGADGKNGISAYERYVISEGYKGTEAEWLETLHGKDGRLGDAPKIKNGRWYVNGKDTGVAVAGEEKTVEITKEAPLAGKTIVNFGDSIFGNAPASTDVSTYLAEITGATVYNLGFGGCRMSAHNSTWDPFSMYQLAYAITAGDFTQQTKAVTSEAGKELPSYFAARVETLKSINFNDVDIITIAYGTNDFTASQLGESDRTFDFNTFKGALRYSIKTIQKAYPHINIYICTPTYRAWLDKTSGEVIEDSDDRENKNGVKLTDFVRYAEEVAAEYKLPVIDNYYELGINLNNRSRYFPGTDGTHHNELGRYLLAKHIADELF